MKRLILNSFFTLITGVIFTNVACAQTEKYNETDISTLADYLKTSYCPHELSVWATGGISMLNYKFPTGKSAVGAGYAFGLGYTMFFNPNWGLSFGAEYAFYQSRLNANQIQEAYDTYDIAGNPIVYHSSVENYREKQQLGMINFPLAVLYQVGAKHKYYASFGLKLGAPVYGKYKGNDVTLTTSGYYPDYDQTEIWQNDFGYGVFPVENKKTLNFGVPFMGTLETGARWNIGFGKELYTGVFVDYGFNNILNNSNSGHFVEYNYNQPSQPVMNSFLASQNGRVSPLSFGLKLKMAFSVGCRDLLNDHKAYKRLQSAGHDHDDYFDFKQPVQPVDTIPATTAVMPVNTKPEIKQDDLTTKKEVLTYLEAAEERRQKYSQYLDLSNIRSLGNYNLGIVTLTAEQEAALDDYADLLKKNSHVTLEITGHTCDLGSEDLNQYIGQERADLAKDYLVEKGIAPSRIQTFSNGKNEPAFPNNNEVNRKKNRRLEIVIKE